MPRISKEELLKLQKTLKTDTLIGQKYGIARQAVHQIRQLYGISVIRKNTTERNNRIVEAYKKGVFQKTLAKKFNLCEGTIYRVIKAAGAGKKKRQKSKDNP